MTLYTMNIIYEEHNFSTLNIVDDLISENNNGRTEIAQHLLVTPTGIRIAQHHG